MKSGYHYNRWGFVARLMAGGGALGAVLLVLLRVFLFPAERDLDTGLFSSNILVIGASVAMLAALGALLFLLRSRGRNEITGKPSLLLAVALLVVGAAMVLYSGWDVLNHLTNISYEETSLIVKVLPWVQIVFCILGGVAFVLLGMRIASEGGTRRGMAQWGLLAPVMWLWLVLANYEMSPDSMVRVTDGGFFTLAMYIMEMLFLLRFACYIAGIGQVNVGSMLFFSAGTVVFSVSAPVVRLLMYLLQDVEASSSAGAAGPLDLAVGLLALAVSITLCQSMSDTSAEEVSAEDDGVVWEEAPDELPDVELIEEIDSEEDNAE